MTVDAVAVALSHGAPLESVHKPFLPGCSELGILNDSGNAPVVGIELVADVIDIYILLVHPPDIKHLFQLTEVDAEDIDVGLDVELGVATTTTVMTLD